MRLDEKPLRIMKFIRETKMGFMYYVFSSLLKLIPFYFLLSYPKF